MMSVIEILSLLAENAPLIETIFDALKSGTPAQAIVEAVVAAKLATSDAAMREELAAK